MLNKQLLYKFFKGETSFQEEVELKKWMAESKENERFFLQERFLYDSILLNKDLHQNEGRRAKFKTIVFWNSLVRVAAVVLFLTTVGLLLNKVYENSSTTNQLNTVIVPVGQRINLIMADNSSVWLNSNTTFKYPTKFSKKQREVYLDGEAHFEVTANEKRPFTVRTSQGGIKVTGTTFNVSAYSKHDKFETSLFEGHLRVYLNNSSQIINIDPAQSVNIENGKAIISQIKDYDKYIWKKGLIAFDNKKLDEILSVLEPYFNIKIVVDADSIFDNAYTGKFRQSDGIDYILGILQKNIQFTYERDNENQVIYIKNN